MPKRKFRGAAALALAGALLTGGTAVAKQHEGGGLAELMQSNRDSLQQMVDTAYFTSLERKLGQQDYQQIRKQAETISANAKQARQKFSRGEKFDKIARKLEEHASKTAQAAAEGKLPDVNVEIGEMAEYCAACHNAFRW